MHVIFRKGNLTRGVQIEIDDLYANKNTFRAFLNKFLTDLNNSPTVVCGNRNTLSAIKGTNFESRNQMRRSDEILGYLTISALVKLVQ